MQQRQNTAAAGESSSGASADSPRSPLFRLSAARRQSAVSQSAVTNTAMASCFQECKVTVSIHLHPSRLENVRAGIDEQLSEFLMEYVRTR